MVKDGKLFKGTVPLGTRVLARGVQDLVFKSDQCEITVPGEVIFQTKEQCLWRDRNRILQEQERIFQEKRLQEEQDKNKEIEKAEEAGWITVKSNRRGPKVLSV